MVDPVAVTLKLVEEPAQVETFWGWLVILTGLFTASVAVAELRLVVQVPFKTTLYLLPFIAAVRPVRLRVAAVPAVVILVQVVPPSVLTCH